MPREFRTSFDASLGRSGAKSGVALPRIWSKISARFVLAVDLGDLFVRALPDSRRGAANGADRNAIPPVLPLLPMTDTAEGAPEAPGEAPSGRFAAFRHSSFVRYFLARLFTTFGAQILSIAVIWHIYELTRSALYTGLVGLVQFLPLALLVLVTGTAADQFGRRLIMGLSIVLAAACAVAMALLSWTGLDHTLPDAGHPGRVRHRPRLPGPGFVIAGGGAGSAPATSPTPSPGTRLPGRRPPSSARPPAACCSAFGEEGFASWLRQQQPAWPRRYPARPRAGDRLPDRLRLHAGRRAADLLHSQAALHARRRNAPRSTTCSRASASSGSRKSSWAPYRSTSSPC